jgi:4a-hydroxytetrahydrobiopterin dehydratase
MRTLTDAEIAKDLTSLAGWAHEGGVIAKTYTFAGFPQAIAFVVRVAFLAEEMDHHPDLDIRWAKVKVALSTHDAGGVTANDVKLATQIEGVVG